MSDSSSSPNPGIGLIGLLGVVFIVLKLCGVIGWHWAWVLGPFWIPLALAFLILLGFFCVAGLCLAVVAVGAKVRE